MNNPKLALLCLLAAHSAAAQKFATPAPATALAAATTPTPAAAPPTGRVRTA